MGQFSLSCLTEYVLHRCLPTFNKELLKIRRTHYLYIYSFSEKNIKKENFVSLLLIDFLPVITFLKSSYILRSCGEVKSIVFHRSLHIAISCKTLAKITKKIIHYLFLQRSQISGKFVFTLLVCRYV